ncbi:uncharacterized protein CBL_13380 [Carabus blaptoides fortunei]
MKLWLVLVHIVLVGSSVWASLQYEGLADNEFAEFEEFDAEDEDVSEIFRGKPEKEPEPINADVFQADDEAEDDIMVEDDDNEFEHFQDEEEFEGFSEEKIDPKNDQAPREPKITITKVPLHFRANWDSYWLEILMVAGLVVYFLNFFTGKSKNTKLANAWFSTHRTLLEENYSLVGDDSKLESDSPGLIKESENMFTLWCSGRTCCEGMLVELKFIKRQDLVAVIAGMMRPTLDQVHIKVIMNKEDMDTFIMCVATKKTAQHFSKEMADLSVYCPERKAGDRVGLPSNFNVMSEIPEATSAMLDSRMTAVFNKYADMIDYIHFSDQFSGVKQPDDGSSLKLPDVQKVLMFGFNVPVKGKPIQEAMEQLKPLMVMVFYCMDKVKKYRLTKEGKSKADKNRQRVEEVFLKSTHVARAEAAAARREERRRQEKERVLSDADPERQRRWEEKEQKRQLKKKAPKMKQLKVKAL